MQPRYAAFLLVALPLHAQQPAANVSVDKEKKTVSIECVVAPRKVLEKIYPIEVVATFAAPKGQKAHETVVNYTAKPSEVHKALEGLGLKPGKPVRGKDNKPTGAEVDVFLEIDGKRVPIEETLVDQKTGKALAKQKWHFTGSVMSFPDPEKDDKVYGADLTGTLITLFSVTDETVLQSGSGLEESVKVETNPKVLPKVGTKIKLVIQAR
jgi:hypothetical protein